MGKTIAIVNQKGGVGKTTSAVNLAAAVGQKGYKTLLVDIDPQGNATSGLGFRKKDVVKSSYDVLVGGESPSDIIQATKFRKLDLMPSNMQLAGAELEIADMENRTSRLKSALISIKENYDFIFLDCPPSLGLITINALCAVDSIIVPIQCEYYALEGLSQLMNTVRQVKRLYNPLIDIEGVLLTMFDGRLNLTQQVVSEVKRFFPQKVYATVIPRNVRLSEAPSFGQPVSYFDRGSKGSKAYDELATEFLRKNGLKPQEA
ncbi:MAG: ParA family protein [Acutalibacteraceae bacterium]